jgi:hypothetical protein
LAWWSGHELVDRQTWMTSSREHPEKRLHPSAFMIVARKETNVGNQNP